jgi:DNA-binding transcriptional ArsR family regulator
MTSLPLVECCAPLAEPALTDDDARELEQVFETLLDVAQPTVSYHLKQLLNAGIVERETRGAFAHYSLSAGALARVGALLQS